MSERREEKSPASELAEQTLEEHGSCMKLVAEVESCLDSRPDDVRGWLADLRRALSSLKDAMQQHMKDEEAGPIFRRLPERYPRLAAPLERLESEHPELQRNIGEVLKCAQALDNPELFDLRELNARVQLFVARLRRHEAAENEIVLEAYWDDFGGGD
jgi:iron-sulfur cluster repair protein YtfE (RIC family)